MFAFCCFRLAQWCTVAELKQKFPLVDESYAPVFDHETTAATRFPEKREDMVERARDTASKLVEKYGGDGNILIVGHGSSVCVVFFLSIYSQVSALLPGIDSC